MRYNPSKKSSDCIQKKCNFILFLKITYTIFTNYYEIFLNYFILNEYCKLSHIIKSTSYRLGIILRGFILRSIVRVSFLSLLFFSFSFPSVRLLNSKNTSSTVFFKHFEHQMGKLDRIGQILKIMSFNFK